MDEPSPFFSSEHRYRGLQNSARTTAKAAIEIMTWTMGFAGIRYKTLSYSSSRTTRNPFAGYLTSES